MRMSAVIVFGLCKYLVFVDLSVTVKSPIVYGM